MRKTITFLVILTLVLNFSASYAADVDFQEELQKMANYNAKGYIGPFSTAFGTAMNSGLYHTAKPHGLLGFDVSLKAMYVTVSDEAKVFDFMLPSLTVPADPALGLPNNELTVDVNTLYPDRETSTVFGDSEPGNFEPDPAGAGNALEQALLDAGKTQAEIDVLKMTPAWGNLTSSLGDSLDPIPKIPGIGFGVLPLMMPQVSVGLIKGTEVMLRFFPETETTPEIGKVGLFGFGIKHNIDQWIPIPLFPVKISGQFVYQKLTVGDLLESKHTNFNIQASKKLGLGISITPYLGLGVESSTLDVNYTIENTGTDLDGEKVSFSLDGDNGFRMTVGATVCLLLASINVDYSMGEYNVISAGFGITFR